MARPRRCELGAQLLGQRPPESMFMPLGRPTHPYPQFCPCWYAGSRHCSSGARRSTHRRWRTPRGAPCAQVSHRIASQDRVSAGMLWGHVRQPSVTSTSVRVAHIGVAAVPGRAVVRRRGAGRSDQGGGRSHRHGVLPGAGSETGTGVSGRGGGGRGVGADRRVPVRIARARSAGGVLHRAGARDRRAARHSPVGVPSWGRHRGARGDVRGSRAWGAPARLSAIASPAAA
jgi:hypothetical protein